MRLPAAPGGANESSFTSELWFKTTAPTGMLLEVFAEPVTGADRSLYLKAGNLCCYVFAPTYSELCTAAAPLNDDEWHHAAGTLGPVGQLLFVDGVLAEREPTVTASAFDFDTTFRAGYGYIGPNGPLTYFAGELDEIRIWSVALSQAAIVANLARPLDLTRIGLQGDWPLDGSGSQATAPDATAQGNDGALQDFSFASSPWVSPGAF